MLKQPKIVSRHFRVFQGETFRKNVRPNHKQQYCLQSTKRSNPQDGLEAKPYEDIPTLSSFKLLQKHLPGGDYANLGGFQLLMAMKSELGPIYRIKGYFGRPDSVITHNPDDFEKVVRNEGAWPLRPTFGGIRHHRSVHRADFYQGVEGLLATHGEKWASFRSVVNPILLKPKNVLKYIEKLSQVNRQLIERIHEIRDNQTFEVPATFEEEINRWSLESICVVALDKHLGLMTSNRSSPDAKIFFQFIRDFFTYSVAVTFKPPIWKLFRAKSFQKLIEAQDGVLNFAIRHVDEALQRIEKDKRNCVPEKPGHETSVFEKLLNIDKKIAIVMAMDMVNAGVDTTSTAMTGLLLSLAKNPEKQTILRKEILQALPSKESTFDESTFKNLPYLTACLKESLRMYPVIWGGSRLPANDVVLSGYRVPKRTSVSFITNSLLTNDAYYPRAKEFLPERWLRADSSDTSTKCPMPVNSNYPFIYIPFGFGARHCIGRRIAELELKLGVAYLVRNFQIDFNYTTENAFKNLFIKVPNIPLKFTFSDIEY